MKPSFRTTIAALTLLCNTPLFAEDAPCTGQIDCLPIIAQYIKNLGGHFGFLLSDPLSPESARKDNLVDPTQSKHAEQNLLQTQLGAMTIVTKTTNSTNPTFYHIAPEQILPFLNSRLDATFAYISPTQTSSLTPSNTVSALTQSPQTDLQPYQVDPTSQAILNLLYTPPDNTSCPGYDKTRNPTPENCLSVESIVTQSVSLPKNLNDYFNPKANNMTDLIAPLNNNILITPLLISNANNGESSDVSVEQATTFIRYVSGTLLPPVLPNAELLDQIITSKKIDTFQNFIANLRMYTAQVSVGLSNLYYILSKRLPQPDVENQQTSQAMNEYRMAAWRLFNLNPKNAEEKKENKSWSDHINEANLITLQKEMVTLLAEMNYQLYLNRQQQERLLLTNSVLLLMSAKSGRPDASALAATLTQANNAQPTS